VFSILFLCGFYMKMSMILVCGNDFYFGLMIWHHKAAPRSRVSIRLRKGLYLKCLMLPSCVSRAVKKILCAAKFFYFLSFRFNYWQWRPACWEGAVRRSEGIKGISWLVHVSRLLRARGRYFKSSMFQIGAREARS